MRPQVFDELWKARLPPAWMYAPLPSEPEASAANLLRALSAAAQPAAAQWLEANSVDISWEGATTELLAQYDRAIEANMPYRREKSSNKVRACAPPARAREARPTRACCARRAPAPDCRSR